MFLSAKGAAASAKSNRSEAQSPPARFPVTHDPAIEKPVTVRRPAPDIRGAVIVASPHSGRNYAPELMERSALDLAALRGSEDAFVDDLYAAAPEYGAPLVCAEFPRVFVDVNRGEWELDPAMFADSLPPQADRHSRRAASGLGVVPRIGADGRNIHAGKLPYLEARRRIDTLYRPYHDALAEEVALTRAQHGVALVIDAHSMPNKGAGGADVVIGDLHGRACAPEVSDAAIAILTELGFVAVRNKPYAGGHTTERYGRPGAGLHGLQIELNRSLYMNEGRLEPGRDYDVVKSKITQFLNNFMSCDWVARLAP